MFNAGVAPFTRAGTALIEPYLALDSCVIDPGDYTLAFSPSIINAPENVAVPDLST